MYVYFTTKREEEHTHTHTHTHINKNNYWSPGKDTEGTESSEHHT